MRAPKVKWLDRTLVVGPYLALCLTEAEYLAAAKRVGWTDSPLWCNPGGGHVHMEFKSSRPVAIVCMDYEGNDAVEVAGIIAHESLHIWQDWLIAMGEESPGDEISAYAVQNLTVVLMSEWARRQDVKA